MSEGIRCVEQSFLFMISLHCKKGECESLSVFLSTDMNKF